MTAQDAELVLIANGCCQRDAYDVLADNGFDPHPEAEPSEITNEQLERLLAQKGNK